MRTILEKKSEVRFDVRALDDEGAGVGLFATDRSPTFEVHVPGALPGEEITAHVEDVSSHRPTAWAALHAIHRPSASRVAPACPAYGRCGGCLMQHLDVREQLAWKSASLRALVQAHPALAGVAVGDGVPSPLSLGYRNNSKLAAAADASGRLVLGAFAPRSHDVVDVTGCAVTEAALAPVAATLQDLLRAHDVQPYDERHQLGTVRYAILRASAVGQVLVTLVTATDTFDGGVSVATTLRQRHGNVVGVVQNVNLSRGNFLFGDRERTLDGASTIEDRIGDVRLRISSRAFFQANRHVARAAYDAITHGLAPARTDVVVDAYAGVGGIALTLATSAGTVIGIEQHPATVDDAIESAKLNLTTNARFIAGDVSGLLAGIERADIVVLNPPRKGCAPDVLRMTAALRPRAIAYLSCAPKTLVRDLVDLASLGFGTKSLTTFDMLPHTTHVETLAFLTTHAKVDSTANV